MDRHGVARKPTLLERARRLFGNRRVAIAVASSPLASRLGTREATVAGAHFSLVGLADLKEQLGSRWPQLSDRVHELAEAVIQRHVTRGDVFDRYGEDGYVVLFTQLTQVQAEFKCRVIAKEIAAKLLGADWKAPSTNGRVFELPESAVVARPFEEALDDAISRGRSVILATATPEPRISSPSLAGAALESTSDQSRSMTRPLARDPRTPGYTPVWDFGVEALLHFRFNSAPQPPTEGPSEVANAKTDISALNQVLFDLSRLTQVGRRLPVICPVHLETLLREGWCAQVARMIRSAPAPLRRLVTLEVIAAVESNPDWIRSLETAWGALPGRPVARVMPAGPKVPTVSSSLITHLNLLLPDDFSATKSGFAALELFVQRGERAGMTCGVLGLRTRPAALAATAAGFRQLSGPAIHADVPSLGHAIHFDLRSLYRDLFPRAG